MVGAMARGTYTRNSLFFRAMTWKGYHNDSSTSDTKATAAREMGTEEKSDCHVEGYNGSWWAPHQRTGIYYPKGHERVMEDVPIDAAKSAEIIHSFSCSEDVHPLFNNK